MQSINEAITHSFDLCFRPTLLLRPDGLVIRANQSGRLLLQSGSPLCRTDGKLSLRRRADHDAVMAALADGPPEVPVTYVHLTSRQESLTHVLAFSRLPSIGLVDCAIAELRRSAPLPAGWSATALGLRPAYAELAEALMSGENLAEFAQRAQMTLGGVRTRLKKLALMLGARSQADLVGIIHRAATVVAPHRGPGAAQEVS